MARKYIVVGYVLLQSLSLIGSEGPSDRSQTSVDNLRNSRDNVSRSQSQELQKAAAKAVVANMYFDSPCGGGWVNVNKPGSDYRHDMKPYPPYFGGCP